MEDQSRNKGAKIWIKTTTIDWFYEQLEYICFSTSWNQLLMNLFENNEFIVPPPSSLVFISFQNPMTWKLNKIGFNLAHFFVVLRNKRMNELAQMSSCRCIHTYLLHQGAPCTGASWSTLFDPLKKWKSKSVIRCFRDYLFFYFEKKHIHHFLLFLFLT